MLKAAEAPPRTQPLIPERILDVPSQRLYYLSLGLLCQAIKILDFFTYLFSDPSTSTSYVRKWILVDALYCGCLSQLRIPRLNYSKSVVILQIVSLCLSDAFLFGGITVNIGLGPWRVARPAGGFSGRGDIVSTDNVFSFTDILPALGLGSFVGSSNKETHLLGQHTVRMSPISTAQLNPNMDTFCIASPGQSVLIPLLLNNTSPTSLRYTLTPLGYAEKTGDKKGAVSGRVDRVELSAKEMKAIEQSRLDSLEAARTASTKRDTEDYDEYDDDDDDDDTRSQGSGFSLQKSQSLQHIKISKPGVLRLERVIDSANVEARLAFPTEVTIAPCPRASFVDDGVISPNDVRCAAPGHVSGAGEQLQFSIDIYGVPPLSLRWIKEVNGRREFFMVEGIEEEALHSRGEDRRAVGTRTPHQVVVPLTVTLDALGTHSYRLEYVTDALGNVVSVISMTSDAKQLQSTTRTTTVVRRPTVSFRHCGPGNPAALLVGSETALTIATKDADDLDSPWDITVKYRPTLGEEKRFKSWSKILTTPVGRRDLTLHANSPGEYTITGIKGSHCEGDVLSPDMCKVVERPHPTAEIAWKKIHECSGDTGVSASLVLHGTPPFTVYYTTQRDKEPPQEKAQNFPTSRGELTIQPDRSGHYTFAFTQLSDAHYKKVALKGPSIDQVVHPPASADFSPPVSAGRSKRRISSCSGNTVDVNVELRGTGPWNLDVQVVGPKGSEIIHVKNITTPKKTIQVPIPSIIDRDGGSFEIDLVSVEDSYGCKRPVTVTGIAVNVRRIKPTAKFYGSQDRRQVTILEGDHASLPLRLTGDGPWRVKYRLLQDPTKIHSIVATSANEELRVEQEGTYEILNISDLQCPGTVVEDSATYRVSWVPRPAAKLSPEIQATYEAYNGSHILPPICEGIPDHVDLDLTGRPPFQIMYNVARDGDHGATKIIDQPVFSSIQPRTRFQLHTSEAARIYYEVKQIGDAAYPLAKSNALIPRSERLLFEQQVLMRPSARFRTNNRITYCMNDILSARDLTTNDGLIVLQGTPPFQLQLSIKNLAASEIHHESIILNEHAWKLDVPSYTFKSVGPHLITIDSIQDASHCEQVIPDPLYRSIWADVAETAAIVPFDRREHFCINDVAQFQLEGIPPWTIGYRVNGKNHVQEVKTSPFSVQQQQAGEFAITSIAHQHKMCKTSVTDLRYTVHQLPSAQVGHGKRVIQDIHEGDQAEIVFTLIGEPPFTFTYQRTELSPKKGVQGKVMETHTVSGVTAKEYSIFSALEGTWTVTFISDKYCRYPPSQTDMLPEKSK
ncbi:hypothetical protein C8Q75DRAFT_809502 [Abortiporus biennis]|nr:hypothetical protein C8Q75DRAFT_809502 [Abortiporus biennis]